MTAEARSARSPFGALDDSFWPNVRGKRCLVVHANEAEGGELCELVAQRGAREIVDRSVAAPTSSASLAGDGRGAFDVVFASAVLRVAVDAAQLCADLAAVTRGVLVSVEPIDVLLSLVGRGQALARLDLDGAPLRYVFNGGAHRRLLERAGFAIERVSNPFTVAGDGPPPAGLLERLAVRALVRGPLDGPVHRALLARPRVPATA